MTSSGGMFLMECRECGMKINESAQQIGGKKLCQHKMRPYTQSPPPVQKRQIIYPTDAENKWIKLMDKNKIENQKHSSQFEKDIELLSKLKSTALEDIKKVIDTLQNKLNERSIILQKQLNDAFEKRQNQIYLSLKQLSDHKKQNIEIKEQSEDLLCGSTPQGDREKTIVDSCSAVIKSTPHLKYVPTELNFTFDALDFIQQRISTFGKLKTQAINSGNICLFESISGPVGLKVIGPIDVNIPIIELRNSSFDDKKFNIGKVKLGFKVVMNKTNAHINFNIMDYISINVLSIYNDDDQKVVDFSNPTDDATIKFSECSKNKNKYDLFLDYKFNLGSTVDCKMRAIFTSPDKTKYNDIVGDWSKVQSVDIPDDTEVEYILILNKKVKKLTLQDDDPTIKNYQQFAARFIQQFNQTVNTDTEMLILTAVSDNSSDPDTTLDDKSNLAKYTSNSNSQAIWRINGKIIKLTPVEPVVPVVAAVAVNNNNPGGLNNNNNNNMIGHGPGVHGGPGSDESGGFVALSHGHKQSSIEYNNGNDKVIIDRVKSISPSPKAIAPKKKNKPKPQISIIVVYNTNKKRVNLKHNNKRKVFEYNMGSLRNKILNKFSKNGLNGSFELETENGNKIQNDDDIVNTLSDYKGIVHVKK